MCRDSGWKELLSMRFARVGCPVCAGVLTVWTDHVLSFREQPR